MRKVWAYECTKADNMANTVWCSLRRDEASAHDQAVFMCVNARERERENMGFTRCEAIFGINKSTGDLKRQLWWM